MSENAFKSWLAAHENLVAPMEKQLSLEYWALATTGKKEHEKKLAEIKTVYRKIYADKKDFDALSAFKNEAKNWQPDSARELDILWSDYAESQMAPALIEELSHLETQIEGIYSNYRGKIDGESVDNNAIRRTLKDSLDNEERRKAWLASKQIGGEVIGHVKKLVELRNRGARECGFNNYYSMSLELDELNEEKLFSLLGKLADLTEKPFLESKTELDRELAKKFKVDAKDLRPWHYADPFFQEAPPTQSLDLDPYFKSADLVDLTRKTYAPLGLSIDAIVKNSDLFARAGKDQHAFCTMIGRSRDVRVLCNIESNEYWMSTMLHEFGHAVYDYYLDENLPYFLRTTAHTLSTEAIAMLFGRLTRNGFWLQEIAGAPANEVKKLEAACKQQQILAMRVFVRWVLVMVQFERELYKNPEQDLNRLWWKLVSKYQHIQIGSDRNEPDWAAKLHLALAPVYYQNYLMGELIASQLQNHLEKSVAKGATFVNHRKAGDFLIEKFFKSGARLRWDHHLKEATQEALNPGHFVDHFISPK